MKFKIENNKEPYRLFFFPCVKHSFFSKWERIGNILGYATADECVDEISKYIEAYKKIKEIENELKC